MKKTITAVGIGTTYIRIKDDTNKIYGSVKVNVNETDGITYPKVAGGQNHQVALKSDGTVWTTGYNGYGQLGTGTTQSETEFKQVTGIPEKVIAITANVHTSYALTESGKVYGWGYNYYGQLGINNNADQTTPVKMQKVSNIIQISAGDSYITMLDANGSVWNVGYNGNGQLGLGDTTNRTEPTKVNIENVIDITAGYQYTAILKNDGTVWSIGYNGYGELGDGSTNSINYLESISTQYIELAEREVTLKLSNPTYQIQPKTIYGFNLLYEEATNNGFKYVSSNTDIATVDEDGIITGKEIGKAGAN